MSKVNTKNCYKKLRKKGYEIHRDHPVYNKSYKWIESKKKEDIDIVFKNIIKIVTDSYSETCLFTANLNNSEKTEVVVKLGFVGDSVTQNGLYVEAEIYKHIISDMINYTPFIVYGYDELTYRFNSSFQGLFTNCKRNKKITIPQNNDKIISIVMEKTLGHYLYDFISLYKKKLNSYDYNEFHMEMINILFQLFWTLKCFSHIRLIHNDLHFNNIFVENLNKPETFYFHFGSKYIKMKTSFIAKIYDFDRSSVPGNLKVSHNLFAEKYFCRDFNQCNKYSEKVDLWSVIYNLYSFIEDGFLTELFPNMFDGMSERFIPYNDVLNNKDIDSLDNFIKALIGKSNNLTYVKLSDIDTFENFYNLPPKKDEILWGHYNLDIKPTLEKIEDKYINLSKYKISKYISNFFPTLFEMHIKNDDTESVLLPWDEELKRVGWNWKNKTLEMILEYYSHNEINIEDTELIFAFLLLSCPIYHRILYDKNKRVKEGIEDDNRNLEVEIIKDMTFGYYNTDKIIKYLDILMFHYKDKLPEMPIL